MFIMTVSHEQSCKGGVEVGIISHLKYGTLGCSPVVEHLPQMCEALGSSFSTRKRENKQRKEQRIRSYQLHIEL